MARMQRSRAWDRIRVLGAIRGFFLDLPEETADCANNTDKGLGWRRVLSASSA
jgi:hypothetical protein